MTEQATPFADGIYFGLDAEPYHADPALGSTDIRKLRRNPSSYWHSSWMNPKRPKDKRTPGRTRGSAMHVLVYEGESKFDGIYMRGAEHTDDMSSAEKGALTKAANASAAKANKIALPADDYDQVCIGSAMITKNPALKTVFSGGASEVSVFWTRKDGVRLKARLDYLKPRGVGDLKGCANRNDIWFPAACINDISNYRYDIQAVHYLGARAIIPHLISDGCVHGDHDEGLLRRIIKTAEYGWQWIFYQMEGAPITWSRTLSPANLPFMEQCTGDIETAIDNFKDYRQRFGTDIWLLIEETGELDMSDMPGWYARK